MRTKLINHAHHLLDLHAVSVVAMVRVYVKGRGETSSLPRTEVKLEKLEGLPVEDLTEAVARLMNIDKQELRQ